MLLSVKHRIGGERKFQGNGKIIIYVVVYYLLQMICDD